jgi:hypothetical protein
MGRCDVPYSSVFHLTTVLTGRCVPIPMTGTVLADTGMVSAFQPMVLPVRNPSYTGALCFHNKPDYSYLCRLFCNLFVCDGLQYTTPAPSTLTTSLITLHLGGTIHITN